MLCSYLFLHMLKCPFQGMRMVRFKAEQHDKAVEKEDRIEPGPCQPRMQANLCLALVGQGIAPFTLGSHIRLQVPVS
jgi:hypothetical protein